MRYKYLCGCDCELHEPLLYVVWKEKQVNFFSNLGNKFFIYDARPFINAASNKVKGGGFEDVENYECAKLIFCDMKERCYFYVIRRDEIMLISLEYVQHREPNFRIISK